MLSVCIADDEILIQKSIRLRLLRSGIPANVLGCAETAEDALNLYRAAKPDVFFVDINMPGKNGLSFIRQAREEDAQCKTKFIIITGYDDFAHMKESIQTGAADYLKKPISQEDFNAALQQAISALHSENVTDERSADNFTGEINLIDKVCAYLKKKFANEVGLNDAAAVFSVSPQYLSRRFHEITGVTFGQYLEDIRMQKAALLLVDTGKNIADISVQCGYYDSAYFSKVFHRRFKMPPSEYRQMRHKA
jgi:YesN/AraC family two-component response regulator